MPWDGKDPRYLTRAFEIFSLSSEGTGRPNLKSFQATHADQIELFPEGTHYGT
jgi:hypothetical protein